MKMFRAFFGEVDPFRRKKCGAAKKTAASMGVKTALVKRQYAYIQERAVLLMNEEGIEYDNNSIIVDNIDRAKSYRCR
jgi:hypothetical protein